MELVEGPTLADVRDRDGVLRPDRAIAIALQILAALEAAHARGVIHRAVDRAAADVDPLADAEVDQLHLLAADAGAAAAEPVVFFAPNDAALAQCVARAVVAVGAKGWSGKGNGKGSAKVQAGWL